MKIITSLFVILVVSLVVNATNVQNLRSQIAQTTSDSPASSSSISSSSHSSSDHHKGDVQYVPVAQTVIVGQNGKESTPLLFHHAKEPNGMIRAATVPRSDSPPVIPLVLRKDGTVVSQTPLVPVNSPAVPASSFIEIEQKKMDESQSLMAGVELSSVTHENEPEKNQQEFEEQYEFRRMVDSTKDNLDEILQKASDLSSRLQDEYTKRV